MSLAMPAVRRTTIKRLAAAAGFWMVASFLSLWAIASTPFDADHWVMAVLGGGAASVSFAQFSTWLARWSHRWTVGRMLLVRTLGHAGLITVICMVLVAIPWPWETSSSVAGGMGTIASMLASPDFLLLLALLLAASFLINLVLQLVRLVGPETIRKLLLGTYSQPLDEDRVFLFVDMDGSTAIAQALDSRRFAELKNDCFHHLAIAVEATRGELFKYLGDAAIVTWPMGREPETAQWARCHALFTVLLEQHRAQYLARYGVAPTFKGGCHGGRVTASEVGDLKRQIDYSGDAINVAARLQDECGRLRQRLLVSDELLSHSLLDEGLQAEPLGAMRLRGRSGELAVHGIRAAS
jgi:adenylate cyclase